jgi:hypothetical protein
VMTDAAGSAALGLKLVLVLLLLLLLPSLLPPSAGAAGGPQLKLGT